MANRADGGLVIVGVSETPDHKLLPEGISDHDLGSWSFDAVTGALSAFADPFVTVAVEPSPYKGRTLLAIRVHEFELVPVICKKDYKARNRMVLRKGAIYVRPRGRPETVEVPSQKEMRDLLDLATRKGIRQFVSTATAAGLSIPSAHRQSDKELYDKELGELV